MKNRSNRTAIELVAGLAVVAGVALRVAYLGSDPSYPSWIGWLGDEGRWTRLGRDLALFGDIDLESPLTRSHLILGPLFQATQALVFAVFGVGLVAARWVSVLAGVGLLFVAARLVRGRLEASAGALVVGLLAIHPDLVFFSRVAIPEMASLALQLVAFALLVGAPRTRRRAGWAGVTMAAAMGFKGTVAPVLPVFAVVALATGRPGDPASSGARCGAFVGWILLLALSFVVAVAAASGGLSAVYSSTGAVADILGFLRFDSLYGAVSVLYAGGAAVRVNLILAALWSVGVALWLCGAPDSEERTIFTGAMVWAIGWIALWSILSYFPERYVVHVHVPLVIALGAALASLGAREERLRGEMEDLGPGWKRWIFATAFMVPLAVQLVAAGVTWAVAAGLPPGGLSEHVVLVALVTVLLGSILAARWSVRAVFVAGFGLPVGMAVAWSAGDVLGRFDGHYWEGHPGNAWFWVGVLAGGLLAAALGSRASTSGPMRVRRFVIAYAGALSIVWVADRVERLYARTYVLDEIRTFLVERYPDDTEIGVEATSSILIDSHVPVRHLFPGNPATRVIVSLENDRPSFRLPYHVQVAEYGVPFGPRHYFDDPTWTKLRIYESTPGAPDPPGILEPHGP